MLVYYFAKYLFIDSISYLVNVLITYCAMIHIFITLDHIS